MIPSIKGRYPEMTLKSFKETNVLLKLLYYGHYALC